MSEKRQDPCYARAPSVLSLPMPNMLGIAIVAIVIVGPLLLALTGLLRSSRTPAPVAPPWNWKLTILSALLFTLAFNLTFFIQELFLVIPKALTPGLRPTLFHNNHTWQGDHPLASLFQGTGALATFLAGVICAVLARRGSVRSTTGQLFLIWMAYNGLLQSLPQVVIGAMNPRNDVGMAMEYFRLDLNTRLAAALVVLAAIPLIALSLRRPMFGLTDDPARLATAGARTRFLFLVATLPALIALPVIVAFRVPREWLEVLLPPVLAVMVGIPWIQAGAWQLTDIAGDTRARVDSVAYPLVAVIVLLAIFQLVLRPGIPFF